MLLQDIGTFVRYRATEGQPRHVAMIVHAWTETCVNLVIWDPNGVSYTKTSVSQGRDLGNWIYDWQDL